MLQVSLVQQCLPLLFVKLHKKLILHFFFHLGVQTGKVTDVGVNGKLQEMFSSQVAILCLLILLSAYSTTKTSHTRKLFLTTNYNLPGDLVLNQVCHDGAEVVRMECSCGHAAHVQLTSTP